MARQKYKIDPVRVEEAWKRAGYSSLKDVFREDGDENFYMRYDGAHKRIKSGQVSYTIMDFLSKRLNCPYEYLSGELTDRMVEDWGIPEPIFSKMQDFYNMSPEEKEQYYLNLIIDMGIASKWMKMDNRQRVNCHIAMREFVNWLLDYVEPDDKAYSELFEFFGRTGVGLESDPEYRKKVLDRLKNTYKVSMKGR